MAEADQIYPESDEEENETKWTREDKIREEREGPYEIDSSTNSYNPEQPRRGGTNRQRTGFYAIM